MWAKERKRSFIFESDSWAGAFIALLIPSGGLS